MSENTDYVLTKFQAEEVEGLLDVCADDFANGNRDTEGWGTLDGLNLHVTDPEEAVYDLDWRAEFHATEGYKSGSSGTSAARSLRSLADKIRAHIDSSGASVGDVVAALEIAERAHRGQVDKGGDAYIGHVIRVGLGGYRRAGVDGLIVGLLHDVVEDTDVSLAELAGVFDARIVDAVDAITHRKGEPRAEYLVRVVADGLAAAVKCADVADNGDPARLARVSDPVVRARLERKRDEAVAALGDLG